MDWLILMLIYLLVLVHISIVFVLTIGAVLAVFGVLNRYPGLRNGYLITVVLTILSFVFTGACFLTTWEQSLRRTYLPETAYMGGFISHYLRLFGITVSDNVVLIYLVVTIVLGVGATLIHFGIEKVKR